MRKILLSLAVYTFGILATRPSKPSVAAACITLAKANLRPAGMLWMVNARTMRAAANRPIHASLIPRPRNFTSARASLWANAKNMSR